MNEKTMTERAVELQREIDRLERVPPVEFQKLSMMELRSAPGEVMDRMKFRGEAFALVRRGKVVGYLIPATGKGSAQSGDGDGNFWCQWRKS